MTPAWRPGEKGNQSASGAGSAVVEKGPCARRRTGLSLIDAVHVGTAVVVFDDGFGNQGIDAFGIGKLLAVDLGKENVQNIGLSVFQREVPVQQGRVVAAVKEYDVGLFHQRGLGIARDADRLGPAGMGDLGHLDDFLADAGIGDKDGRVVVVER